MQDKHKAFFLFLALGVPLTMLALSLHWVLGGIVTALMLLVAKNTSHATWSDLGQLITPHVLTLAVLVGGSFIIFAQTIG